MNFDAWDIDIYYQEKMAEINGLQEAVVEESGPVRGVLRLVWRYGDSTITQRLTDLPRIPAHRLSDGGRLVGTAGAAQGGVPGGGALDPRHLRNPVGLDRAADALEHVVGLRALRGGRAQVGRPVRGRLRRQPAERLQIRPRHQGQHAAPDAAQVGGASGCGSGQGPSRLHVQPAPARGRLARRRTRSTRPTRSTIRCSAALDGSAGRPAARPSTASSPSAPTT